MDRSWIHRVEGRTTKQARVGTVGTTYEELFGRQGFFGPVAMLYHENFPNDVIRIKGPLQPRQASVLEASVEDRDDPRADYTVLSHNEDVRCGISRRREDMPFCYRSADGDLLYFVHTGHGVFATEFGPLAYEPGDYILLPKGTTFRHMPSDADGLFFVTESFTPLRFTDHLQVGRHVPFDPSIIEVPKVTPYKWPERAEWELRIKQQGEFTSVFYRSCPMDLIGWKGDLFPFKINIRDIIPISSDRIHLAPSSWATFETPGFMVVTFVPQMAVADMTSEELPSNHRNIDCDELIFVHGGPRPGGVVLHAPQGFMHGSTRAEREKFESIRTPGMRRTLTGVSIDTYKPLHLTEAFLKLSR